LKAKLSQLSAQMQPVLRRADISCQSETVSTNGLGGADSCLPYRCNQASGLCRQVCRSVDDCAPPYVCGTDYRCVRLQ
jgi:hypothetical protein